MPLHLQLPHHLRWLHRHGKENKKADDREAARERSIKGWEALRALEKKQSAFSWWPGQESE
eukprot:8220420-Prorocentrum_lima.AAC.1